MKTTTLLLLFILLLTYPTQAQKTDLPKGWQFLIDNSSPDMCRFKGKTFTLKTDPVLNYGYQYTNVYKVSWVNDSTFSLSLKREYRKDNNREKTRRKRIRDGWHFTLAQAPYFVISKGEEEKYLIRTSQKENGVKAEGDLVFVWVPME